MAEYAQRVFANGTGTTRTATLASAPTSSQLMVAVHYHIQSSEPNTPSGWTRVFLNDEVSTRRWYIYSRQGNGSVDSFTLSSGTSNVAWATTLLAYDYDPTGFTSGQPAAMWGKTIGTNGTSVTATLSGTSPAYGVAVACGWIGNGTGGQTWGDGFVQTNNQSGIFPQAEKIVTVGQAVAPSLSWSGAQMSGIHAFIVPREAPPPEDNLEYFSWDGSDLTPLEPFGAIEGA